MNNINKNSRIMELLKLLLLLVILITITYKNLYAFNVGKLIMHVPSFVSNALKTVGQIGYDLDAKVIESKPVDFDIPRSIKDDIDKIKRLKDFYNAFS